MSTYYKAILFFNVCQFNSILLETTRKGETEQTVENTSQILWIIHQEKQKKFTDVKVLRLYIESYHKNCTKFSLQYLSMTIQNTEAFHWRAPKVKTILYNIINSTTGKYCSVDFIWMVRL